MVAPSFALLWFGALPPLLYGLVYTTNVREAIQHGNIFDSYAMVGQQAPLPLTTCPVATDERLYARSADGACNSIDSPGMGAAGTRFGRNVPAMAPQYAAMNLTARAAQASNRLYTPNPASLLDLLLTPPDTTNAPSEPQTAQSQTQPTLLTQAWLSFTLDDFFAHALDTNWTMNGTPPLEIPLVANDPSQVLRLAPTLLDADGVALNTETHWFDASQLYGSDLATQQKLREFAGGRLLLDANDELPVDLATGLPLSGNTKHWWIGSSVLHTLFAREHNAVCAALAEAYPAMNDEQLFQKARLVVAASIARITTLEWQSAVMTNELTTLDANAQWNGAPADFAATWNEARSRLPYLPDIETFQSTPGVRGVGDGTSPVFNFNSGATPAGQVAPHSETEEFAAIFRQHVSLPDQLHVRYARKDKVSELVGLADLAYSRGHATYRRLGMENVLWSLTQQTAPTLRLNNYPRALSNLALANGNVLHLALVDLMRERERGVPRYNALRRFLRLTPLTTFADLSDDPAVVAAVASKYASVEDIDLLIGVLAESPRPRGYAFGETTAHLLLGMVARRLRTDRFYQQDFTPAVYTQVGFEWVQSATLKAVMARHVPSLARSNRDVANAFHQWHNINVCGVHYRIENDIRREFTNAYTYGLPASGFTPATISTWLFARASSSLDYGFQPFVMIIILMLMWVVSSRLDYLLNRYCVAYHIAETAHKRNMVTYILELVITTGLFLLNCWLMRRISSGDYTEDHVQYAATSGLLLISLYIYELLYRCESRWQMVLHHLATIILLCVSIYRFEHFGEKDGWTPGCAWWTSLEALIMGMTALTEQPIFAGLLLYRLGRFYPRVFYVCAIQNFCCKVAFILWASVIWAQEVTQPFWWYFFPFVVWGILLPAQMVACSVQWQMGTAMKKKLAVYEATLKAQGKPFAWPQIFGDPRKMMTKEQAAQVAAAQARDAQDVPQIAFRRGSFSISALKKLAGRQAMLPHQNPMGVLPGNEDDGTLGRPGSDPNSRRGSLSTVEIADLPTAATTTTTTTTTKGRSQSMAMRGGAASSSGGRSAYTKPRPSEVDMTSIAQQQLTHNVLMVRSAPVTAGAAATARFNSTMPTITDEEEASTVTAGTVAGGGASPRSALRQKREMPSSPSQAGSGGSNAASPRGFGGHRISYVYRASTTPPADNTNCSSPSNVAATSPAPAGMSDLPPLADRGDQVSPRTARVRRAAAEEAMMLDAIDDAEEQYARTSQSLRAAAVAELASHTHELQVSDATSVGFLLAEGTLLDDGKAEAAADGLTSPQFHHSE